MKTINEYLSLKEFESIIFENEKIDISEGVLRRVKRSFNDKTLVLIKNPDLVFNKLLCALNYLLSHLTFY